MIMGPWLMLHQRRSVMYAPFDSMHSKFIVKAFALKASLIPCFQNKGDVCVSDFLHGGVVKKNAAKLSLKLFWMSTVFVRHDRSREENF